MASGEHDDHDQDGGHPDHGAGGDHAAMFRRRFWVSLGLAVPVLIYSGPVQDWFRFTPPTFPGSAWIAPGLGTVIFVYGGRVFLEGGVAEIRARQPGMMLLISLAIIVAFGSSVATELGALDLEFWWELAALIVVMLLGHWQEMKALGYARGALAALADLLPDEAELITADGTTTVPIGSLVAGDLVLVRPGAAIPADGEITEGLAEIDEAMVTGESKPVAKSPGDRVVAGTVVTDTAIRLRVTAVGDDTSLAGIQRLVAEAEGSKSRAQALADRAAAVLFWVAVVAAIATFGVWISVGTLDQAITRTVTVLVISCPHALGLAIPLVIALTTAIAARQGILVKDRIALERTRKVDAILFDKTGTLTKGEHAVTGVVALDGDEDGLLALAAAVEADSEHPLARAIHSAALELGEIPQATGFRSMSGRGVEATVDGHHVEVGGPSLLRERELLPPESLTAVTDSWIARGAAVLHVVRDGAVIGAISLEDEIRPESRLAVDELHRLGILVIMITGDAHQVANAVGAEIGVDEVFSEVLPEDKDAKVAELQSRGLVVAMVGDGVNDAPALARADVGIAVGAGTDVAIESAGIVLASDDPRAVIGAIRLSEASYGKMTQNLVWAAGYNVLAIPLAAGVLAPVGFVLPPAIGALLMSLSTVVVALNAQTLRRKNFSPEAATPRQPTVATAS